MPIDLDGSAIARRAEKLFRSIERSNAEANWELLAEFILPSQSGVFLTEQSTPGAKRTERVYDSTAIQANTDLAAAIHSTLTNPATKWSKIRFKDDALNNDAEATAWLEAVNNEIHSIINESNFDTQVSKNYQLFSSIGTMVLMHEEKRENNRFAGFKFTAWHLGEVAFSENKDGVVDVLYRKFKLTARQAVEKWGDKVSDTIKEAVEEDPEQEFKFIHCILPRDPKKVKVDDSGLASPKKRPYASYYLDASDKEILDEVGYYEFPAYVTRWQTTPGEVYGRGPGHTALPDIRTLNRVKDLGLHAISKAVNPPMLTTMRNVLGNLDLRPGKLSVVRDPDGIRELVTQARFDATQFSIEDLRTSIRSIFFIDKFNLPPRTETGEMTAFEIAQRLQQMQKVLGPTLSRLNSEFLTPLIVRAFKILLRERALPPAPQIVQEQGINIEIVFVNQLTRAQQVDEINNVRSWLESTAAMAQINPQVLDLVNVDGIAKLEAKLRGVPEVAITNDKEVQQIRQQRQQQQQQQMALEAGNQVADIASKTGGLLDESSSGQSEPTSDE